LAYMFKHALTHDVAYESLLLQRRKQLHETIGRAIEDLYAERLAEYWETLAHHFLRAEVWDKAFAYLVRAGDKARQSFANQEAVQFYHQALEVTTHVTVEPSQRAAILRNQAWSHLCLSDFESAIGAYREALRLTDDGLERADIDAFLGVALWFGHEFDRALDVAREAFALGDAAGDATVKGNAQAIVGLVQLVRGDLDGCTESMRAAAQLMVRSRRNPLLAPWVESSMALKANWQGDYDRALQIVEPILAELRATNELFTFAQVSSHCAITLGGIGRYARALSFLDEAIALAESIGDRFWRARMWNTRGWILHELGAYEQADESNHRCLEITRRLGSLRMTPEVIGNAACNLADSALARGDLAASESHLAEVAAILNDPRNEWMTWRYRMHYQLAAAGLALARGDVGRARELIELCLTAAQQTKSRRYIVRAQCLLARCVAAGGDVRGAATLLGSAATAAAQLRNPPQVWHTGLAGVGPARRRIRGGARGARVDRRGRRRASRRISRGAASDRRRSGTTRPRSIDGCQVGSPGAGSFAAGSD